jgi:hypothetical protein
VNGVILGESTVRYIFHTSSKADQQAGIVQADLQAGIVQADLQAGIVQAGIVQADLQAGEVKADLQSDQVRLTSRQVRSGGHAGRWGQMNL